MKRQGFFARLAALWRGIWGVKLESAEARNAEAVYHQAIQEQQRRHEELRAAASRLVYLRNRLELQGQEATRDLRVVDAALRKAALADEDERALGLMKKKRELEAAVERYEHDRERLAAQVSAAKEGLEKTQAAVETLKHERAEMLARKAHAEAQLSARAAVERALSAAGGGFPALENVREAIARLESDAGLDAAKPGEVSMADLRREAEREGDRDALSALKMELRGRLLPERSGQKLPLHAPAGAAVRS